MCSIIELVYDFVFEAELFDLLASRSMICVDFTWFLLLLLLRVTVDRGHFV